MPHVVIVAPDFATGQMRFVRGLKRVGAHVTGIGDLRPEQIDPELRYLLDGYEHVERLADEDALTAAVQRVQARGPWVDRVECTVESHLLPVAHARARAGIPGLSVEQVTRCRDKLLMKRYLRERGVPCAKDAAVATGADALAFVRENGFPVILKPRSGAGAEGTFRLDDAAALEAALRQTGLSEGSSGDYTIEEFVSGHEGFYDTLCVDGAVAFEAAAHYYPNVLEAMRTRWISPQVVHTNRLAVDGYDELRSFGRRVIQELGLGTTATHMEWFNGPRGLLFSEIGARPPRGNFWDLYCEANEFDLYVEWARAICYGTATARPSQRFAAGLINLRPTQDGTVSRYTGLEAMQRRYGAFIFKMHLPPPGSPTQPIEAGYLANAWVYVKHPDYDALRAVLEDIGQTVKVIAS